MKTREEENFELELKRLVPAQPPEDFMARLLASAPRHNVPEKTEPVILGRATMRSDWTRLLRWLVPASAATALAVVLLQGSISLRPTSTTTAQPVLKADAVQINEQLVSSFDAVAKLPTGEPVRFRFQKWMDNVVLRDKDRGLVVENRTPRIEVIPVGFETY